MLRILSLLFLFLLPIPGFGINTSIGGAGTVNMTKRDSNGNYVCPGGDKGGCSYGTWQIAASTGTMDDFMKYIKINFPDYYDALLSAGGSGAAKIGDAAFVDAWKNLAKNDPERFQQAQYEFIYDKKYTPAANHLSNKYNFDFSEHSSVVQDVIWSMAVQHGRVNDIIDKVFSNSNITTMSDLDLINLMYDEREWYFRNKTTVPESTIYNRTVEERIKAISQI